MVPAPNPLLALLPPVQVPVMQRIRVGAPLPVNLPPVPARVAQVQAIVVRLPGPAIPLPAPAIPLPAPAIPLPAPAILPTAAALLPPVLGPLALPANDDFDDADDDDTSTPRRRRRSELQLLTGGIQTPDLDRSTRSRHQPQRLQFDHSTPRRTGKRSCRDCKIRLTNLFKNANLN